MTGVAALFIPVSPHMWVLSSHFDSSSCDITRRYKRWSSIIILWNHYLYEALDWWSTFNWCLAKEQSQYYGTKTILSTNGAGTTEYPPVKAWIYKQNLQHSQILNPAPRQGGIDLGLLHMSGSLPGKNSVEKWERISVGHKKQEKEKVNLR